MARSKIPSELLQKIKEAVNLVEVVGEHVVLRKSGANYTGLCPFHSERSPSFSVSETKQLYHCYGCKKGGDLISFVSEIHGLSFFEAIEELAERARIPLPKDWNGADANEDPEVAKRRAAQREKLSLAYRLNRFVAAFYHQNLAQNPAVQKYFRSRGVSPDLERLFYVGAAPSGWEALASHMVAKKAPLPLAVELGLIRPSQKGSKSGTGYYDLFRNRAMFPILDMRGKVAGFGGRTLPGGDDAAGDGPKYLNSAESPVFQKSKLAFGLYQAQKHVREKNEVVLVEGYFDVLALHGAGFQNAVATCGTSLSIDHLHLFKRFSDRMVILFDGDKAGVSATERAMELGLEQGWVLYGATMPEGLDPDEVLFDQETGKALPEGRERMEKILAQAQPLLDTRIEEAMRMASQGPDARTQALKKIGGWLARFKDPVGRGVRMQAVVSGLGISQQLLEQAMGGGFGSGQAQQARRSGPMPAGAPSPSARPARPAARPPHSQGKAVKIHESERILLGALARGGQFSEFLATARRQLPPNVTLAELFSYPPAHDFVVSLAQEPGRLELLRSAPETLLRDDLDSQVRSTLTEALVGSEPWFGIEDLKLSLGRRIGQVWAHFSQRLKRAAAEAEAKQDAELHAQLMKEYLDVQRKMKELSSFYDEA